MFWDICSAGTQHGNLHQLSVTMRKCKQPFIFYNDIDDDNDDKVEEGEEEGPSFERWRDEDDNNMDMCTAMGGGDHFI